LGGFFRGARMCDRFPASWKTVVPGDSGDNNNVSTPAIGPAPARPKEWTIRDPIHGHIKPNAQEIAVIDTEAFQRLRRIRQLSNTHLVFPGATHTRFEHCLGTMTVSGSMAERTNLANDAADRVETIRLAGLLHDIGHGPFSHTSERIVEQTIHVKKFLNVQIAVDLIQSDGAIRSALGAKVDKVVDLLQRNNRVGVDYDILDGPIDADKFDYLLRDSHYCGIPYGHADTLRLLLALARVNDPPNGVSLGITLKGVEAVQYLQLARYQMHQNVYRHKTRRIADAMLIRATMLALQEDLTLDDGHFSYKKGDTDFLRMYLELDDFELMRRVIVGGKTAGDIMGRLRKRGLFKRAISVDVLADSTRLSGKWGMRVFEMSPERIHALEGDIATAAHVDPNYVIVDMDRLNNPTYKSRDDDSADLQTVLVDVRPGPRYLHEMTGIWTSEKPWISQKLDVFCPSDMVDAVKRVAPPLIEAI
jgi:uncharacterized protein